MRYAISAMVLAVLSGCASTAKWQHPARAGEGHDGATMALAECESYAAGRTPMPKLQAYMPAPAPTGYNTTGTVSSYGNVSTFQGNTTPSGGLASGYATGANMGANIANAYAVSAARQREAELTGACMRTQGWIDTSTPEGQGKIQGGIGPAPSPQRSGHRAIRHARMGHCGFHILGHGSSSPRRDRLPSGCCQAGGPRPLREGARQRSQERPSENVVVPHRSPQAGTGRHLQLRQITASLDRQGLF